MHERKCVENAFAWPPHGNTRNHQLVDRTRGGGGEHKIEENKKRQRENISKQTDADAAKSGRKKCSEKSARKQR